MSTQHYIRRWLRPPDTAVILLGALIAGVILNLIGLGKSAVGIVQPRALTYTEGVNAILATRPELWFHPVSQAPHFPTIYPLGYHAIVYSVWRLTGLSPFIIMHVVSAIAVIIGAAALALLIRHQTDGWIAPAVACAFWLFSPAVSGVTVLGRVDHLGVMFGLLALLAAQHKNLRMAVVLTVAAMYIKHSLIAFPIAIFLYWFIYESKSRALKYAIGVGGLGLGILAILNVVTDGQAWLHLVEYNSQHPWLFSVLSGQLVWFVYTHAVLVGIIIYTAISGRLRPLTGVFAIVAVLVSLLTIGKVGSWVGYFLPVIAVGAWITGELFEEVLTRPRARTLLLLALTAQLVLYANWAGSMDPKYSSTAQEKAIEDVKTVGGPILAEDGTLYTKTGVEQVHEPLMMRFIYEYPNYHGTTLEDDIEQQRFSRIIIGQSIEDWEPGDTTRWHKDELQAMKKHYVPVWQDGVYYAYAPKET